MHREPTADETRPGAAQLRGESEHSHDEAMRRPEDLASAEAEAGADTRREDLTVAPEDLAARFLSDAVQAAAAESEDDAVDSEQELPVADDDELRDRSRADLPPHATPEGERR